MPDRARRIAYNLSVENYWGDVKPKAVLEFQKELLLDVTSDSPLSTTQ